MDLAMEEGKQRCLGMAIGRGRETVVRGSCCQLKCNDEEGGSDSNCQLCQMQRLQVEFCKMSSSLEPDRHGS